MHVPGLRPPGHWSGGAPRRQTPTVVGRRVVRGPASARRHRATPAVVQPGAGARNPEPRPRRGGSSSPLQRRTRGPRLGHMVPFRFAVQLNKADSAPAWRDLARKVEALGYSTLFIPDHFDDQYGPLVALTVAAEATTDLRVGSLVFGNDYRHPVVLAKEVATLDLFSGGRVELGLGAGWMTTDYEQSGLAHDSPRTRIDRMAESLAIMKALWSEGRVTLAGEHYAVTVALGTPTPHQRP